MKRIATWALAVLGLLVAAAYATSWAVSRPLFDERLDVSRLDRVTIAPVEKALTFARYTAGGELRVMLVKAWENGYVSGVDLEGHPGKPHPDPLALYRQHGYEGLLRRGQSARMVRVPAAALELPFDPRERNIGVGLNYAEHAAESGLEEPPFFFPKYGLPTPFDSPVARRHTLLLDYEAELGLVLLDDLVAPDQPLRFGLVLCNEVTDRWTLVRNLRRDAPMGTTGFADGKSREGFAPLGPLLVIPHEPEVFYRRVELRLYVNGVLRQRESAGAMRWPPRTIVTELFAHAARGRYEYRGQSEPLLGAGPALPAGTVIFSGTPAGVIFKPLNLWNPWVYLQPGDDIVVRGDFLGAIRNRIVE